MHTRATIEQNDRREEEKKNVYRAKEAEAEDRLRQLAIEKEREDARKQAEILDRYCVCCLCDVCLCLCQRPHLSACACASVSKFAPMHLCP